MVYCNIRNFKTIDDSRKLKQLISKSMVRKFQLQIKNILNDILIYESQYEYCKYVCLIFKVSSILTNYRTIYSKTIIAS